ncbi:MAG: hypothetical protein Q9183_005834, partial [Haloplaca sp. 2 TL-2023]
YDLMDPPPNSPALMDVETSVKSSGDTTANVGDSSIHSPTTDSWKALTQRAFQNCNAKWAAAATQEEHRRALRHGGSKSLLLRRDLQNDAVDAVPASASDPGLRTSQQGVSMPSHSRIIKPAQPAKLAKKYGAQPNDVSEMPLSMILTRDPSLAKDPFARTRSSKYRKIALKAAKSRIEKNRKEKSERTIGAKQAARTDALDKAVSGLDLHKAPGTSQFASSSLVLTLPCALTLIEDPTEAQKAYDQLTTHGLHALDHVSFADTSSDQDCWNLQRLIEEEKTLRFQLANRGPDAAQAYQQQRIANAEKLAALHRTYEAAAAAAGLNDDSDDDGGVSLPTQVTHSSNQQGTSYQPPHILQQPSNPGSKLLPYTRLTDAVLSPNWPQEQMTEHQRKSDDQTTLDFYAYKNNPSIKLPKKRYNRVRIALQYGRGDINAVLWEKKQADMVALYRQQQEHERRWAQDIEAALPGPGNTGPRDGLRGLRS